MALKLLYLRGRYRIRPMYYLFFALIGNFYTPSTLLAQSQKKLLSQTGQEQVIIESEIQSTDNVGHVFTAYGNVRIAYPERGIYATSQQAQYLKKENIIVLTGDVDLVRQGRTSLQGERIVYSLDDDQLVADSVAETQVLLKFNLDSVTRNLGQSSL